MTQITDTAVNFAGCGYGNCVSVTDGDGSQVLRGRMGMENLFGWDGYSLCGNGWGWVNVPLSITVPLSNMQVKLFYHTGIQKFQK